MSQHLKVSIGIFAHNEESNISSVIDSLLKQKTDIANIAEILIVSSGSNDKTNKIIRQAEKKDKRIKLLEQFQREGKSAAINLFLRKSTSQVLIIISSDIRLHSEAIEEITLPFLHSSVGMVGAHPVPCNTQHSQVGKEVKLLWHLHHLISLQQPKCGEMVAFRKVIRAIPKHSAVDEATIEVLLKLIGFKILYAPRAIVYNKAPLTAKELLTQRRRIYAGHQWISGKYNYHVSTMNSGNALNAILDHLINQPNDIIPMVRLILLELYGRVLGWFDFYILGKNPYVWKMVRR